MKKHLQNPKVKLGFLALLLVSILWVLTSCNANKSAVPYHEGLQKEYTWEKRSKESESFTLKSYKEDIKALQAKLKELEKSNSENAKKQALIAQMAELRKQIEELEKYQP